ncbi:MAG: 2-isopropylmalate synthase [Casimicrobiaceae bacterium]|nr:2-isopropylmalate synthase [Pseudomonadota bacterium]
MHAVPSQKYRPFRPIDLPDRTWPSRTIAHPPIWLSTDLRDGNQALIEPMDATRKLRMFRQLVDIGFKEIEVAFPSASQTDFDFVRKLIEEDLIPDDVTIQVLTQARDELIRRTFESLRGAARAIVHLYNPTAPLFRRVVYNKDRAGIVDIATEGARLFTRCAAAQPATDWRFEYSPETFTMTELDFALEICERVVDVWESASAHPVILNLPATVEVATPNVFADQIEWMHRHLSRRDRVVISVHPHNDRGTGVAAAELAVMAGADRVEGCLFGNGERTGNVCVVTLAMNLYSQGIDPKLDFSDLGSVIRTAEHCTALPVHPRHPYAGELVFTAFSGSHQDAIKKGFAAQRAEESAGNMIWEVPYLPIDPADVGRTYEAVIRVNSQSGKGGIAYLLERDYALALPRLLQIEFSQLVQAITDRTGKELTAVDLHAAFYREYIAPDAPIAYIDHRTSAAGPPQGASSAPRGAAQRPNWPKLPQAWGGHPSHAGIQGTLEQLTARLSVDGVETLLSGAGNGPVDAFVHAVRDGIGADIHVLAYHEHATGTGEDATAVAYVQLRAGTRSIYGVGLDPNIVTATLKAVIAAVNRGCAQGALALGSPVRAATA